MLGLAHTIGVGPILLLARLLVCNLPVALGKEIAV